MTLRWRVLIGAVFWTAGFFVLTSVVLTAIMFHHRSVPLLLHTMFGHWVPSLAIAMICLFAGLWHVRRGLAPVNQLRARLAAVHGGQESRVDGSYPAEIQPLVDDLNALLAHQELTVQRAVAKAGDLAHGLKTPLAVLSQEAERAGASGHRDVAAAVAGQVERMRRQVEHHLAQARAAASGATPAARCAVLESAEGLVRTLQRLYAERGLTFVIAVPDTHIVRVHREDLDEMLGNLLDNACKWTKSRVELHSAISPDAIILTIDDDGAGIPDVLREGVLQRGVRADEAAPGSGFGLAIVRDLAELYGGSISLSPSALGGLSARLELPRAV